MEPVNVLCFSWGTKYGAPYVNRLYRATKRNMTLPFRFICMTDDPTGYDEGVETLNLSDYPIEQGGPRFEARQLLAFAPKLGDLKGKMLVLDLDVVIVDNIDCFFEHPGDFVIIHDWLRPSRITGNSSVVRTEIGKHTFLMDNYVKDVAGANAKHTQEQDYVAHQAAAKGAMSYWPEEWVISFKRQCLPKGIMSFFKAPVLPKGAKIVVFHGNPNPDEARDGKQTKWFRGQKPTPWIAEHWK